MGRRARLSKPQKTRTYSMIGKYGEYDITAESYGKAMEKLDKAEKLHEISLENPAGPGQTFLENAAEEASFGLYSKAKSGITGEEESIIDARMDRNAEENPLSGMAGTGVGLVAGGGGAGMAVKGGLKLAGKGLAKAGATRAGNFVQKVPVGNFKRGVYEGAVGGAGIEAIEAGKDLYKGNDVRLGDAASNVAIGAAGGGVLGKTLSGAAKRLNTRRGTKLGDSIDNVDSATKAGFKEFDDSIDVHNSVLNPKVRRPEDGGLPIEDLFTDTKAAHGGYWNGPDNFPKKMLKLEEKAIKSGNNVSARDVNEVFKRSFKGNLTPQRMAEKSVAGEWVKRVANQAHPGSGKALGQGNLGFSLTKEMSEIDKTLGRADNTAKKAALLKDDKFLQLLERVGDIDPKKAEEIVVYLSRGKLDTIKDAITAKPNAAYIAGALAINPSAAIARIAGYAGNRSYKRLSAKKMAEEMKKSLLQKPGLGKELGLGDDFVLSTPDSIRSPKAAKLGDLIYPGTPQAMTEELKRRGDK